MRTIKGIIEVGYANGRIDFVVEKPDGRVTEFIGVVIYNEQIEPMDSWLHAIHRLQWRQFLQTPAELARLRSALATNTQVKTEVPRIPVLEVSVAGGSSTTYIDPCDIVRDARRHEP